MKIIKNIDNWWIDALFMIITDRESGKGLQKGRTLFSMKSLNVLISKKFWKISQSRISSNIYTERIDQYSEYFMKI